MSAAADILARQNSGGLLELVVVLVVLGIAALAWMLQKRLSAKQEQQEEEYDAQRRREVEEDRQGTQQVEQDRQAGPLQGEAAPYERPRPGRTQPVRRPPAVPPWGVIEPTPMPAESRRRPEFPPAAPSVEAASSVVHRRRSGHRAKSPAPAELLEPARLGPMIDLGQAEQVTHKAMTTAQPVEDIDPATVQVVLDSPDAARMAILYQEILGPPLSLRRVPTGLWEI
jgi:type IV secretory pathway VirB10-like protein